MPSLNAQNNAGNSAEMQAQINTDGTLAGQFWTESLAAMDKFTLDLEQLVEAAITRLQKEGVNAVVGINVTRADAIHAIRALWSEAITAIQAAHRDEDEFTAPRRMGGVQEPW